MQPGRVESAAATRIDAEPGGYLGELLAQLDTS
jgi:hypothetical protein